MSEGTELEGAPKRLCLFPEEAAGGALAGCGPLQGILEATWTKSLVLLRYFFPPLL